MHGNFTDMGGYFTLEGLEPGIYTFGFSRRFGLGPVIAPSIEVRDGKTTPVVLMDFRPYEVRNADRRSGEYREFAQGFVSVGECVREARLDVKVPEGTGLVWAIREGAPGGGLVGPESADGTWGPGEVRLEQGRRYYLTVRRADGEPFSVALGPGVKGAPAYGDGGPIPDAAIGGRLSTDRTGILVTSFPPEGELFGPCERKFGQTFVARGTGLAMVDFIPAIGGGRRSQTTYTVRVREGGPGGSQVGPAKTTRGSDFMPGSFHGYELRCVLWDRGEVKLVPSRTYFVEIESGQEGFQVSTHEGTLLGGKFYRDGREVEGRCLDSVVIEYEPDGSPPPPVDAVYADLAGTAVQVSFDVPEDMDVNRAIVSRSNGRESQTLADFGVCPGRMEVFVDRSAAPGAPSTYSVALVDAAGNVSPPRKVEVFVEPITAESNLLVNGDFVSRTQASGGLCPGWDTASLDGGVSWSVSRPREGEDFYAIHAWQKYSRYDVAAFQAVPVEQGREYVLMVRTNRKDPFQNGGVNEVTLVGIDPTGGTDAGADSVAWSAPEYVSGVWTEQTVRSAAKSDRVTVFLRARALFGGLGMEGIFAGARLRMIDVGEEGGAR